MSLIVEEVVETIKQDEIKIKERFVYRPRRLALERYQEILAELKEKFPLLFAQEKIRIMKKKIHLDILANTELSKEEVRSFLYQYCNTKKYLKAHKIGALRYDLDGNEIEEVTEQEVEAKQQMLKLLEQQNQQRKMEPMKE